MFVASPSFLPEKPIIDYLYNIFEPLLASNDGQVANFGNLIPIPKFQENDIRELCSKTLEIVQTIGPIVDLEPPVNIIGDLHGDIHDLIRIISKIGDISSSTLLFLGDYVDRGGFSIEVIILLFTLVCKFPNNIVLLRGNHEFPSCYSASTFCDELKSVYPHSGLFGQIQTIFSYLPLAALIGKTFLCVHGGIGPTFQNVEDIRKLKLPIDTYSDPLISDIIWSDPSKAISNFLESNRGVGYFYGHTVTQQFLQNNKLKMIIRAHQCVPEGFEVFRDLVLTVFSSSYYNNEENNAAFVTVTPEFEIIPTLLSPMKSIKRSFALFVNAPARSKIVMSSSHTLQNARAKALAGLNSLHLPKARPKPRESHAVLVQPIYIAPKFMDADLSQQKCN